MNDLSMNDLTDDIKFMTHALKLARQAFDAGEVPVGAVVVCDGRIIGEGRNMTEQLCDVTAHAEMIALTAAANHFGGKYLTDCTLYVTVEPCLMCAGAIGWSQCRRIVIGTPDPRRGYSALTNQSPFHPKAEVISGILEEECKALMQNFFKTRRK